MGSADMVHTEWPRRVGDRERSARRYADERGIARRLLERVGTNLRGRREDLSIELERALAHDDGRPRGHERAKARRVVLVEVRDDDVRELLRGKRICQILQYGLAPFLVKRRLDQNETAPLFDEQRVVRIRP